VDFTKHIQKAEEALKRRNWDFAVEVYRQLLDIDPDHGEARAGLRVAYRKKHEAKRGSKLLRAIGGAMPLVTAKSLRKAGKHGAAAKQLEGYLASNPMDVEANLLLGRCLEDAGWFQSARAVYEYLAEIAPKSPEGLKRAGAMMHRTGEPAKALEYYERALAADPRDQEALKARKDLAAESALASARYDQVQHSRDQIKDKDQARQLERSRRRHLSAEDLQEELTRLETRFADDPRNPDLMLEIATIHERLHDWEAALDFVERAASYKKDSYELICKEGDLRSRILKKELARAGKDGDQEAASTVERQLWEHEAKDYRRRVELHPGDAELRVGLGRRLMRLDELDAALAEFQKAQADPRVQRDAVFCMAQCFQRKGFRDLARKEYERALEGVQDTDERAKEILYNLGSISEEQGQAEEAGAFYARVYQVDIGYRDVAAKMEQFQ